jgi:hypothetical protein
MKSCGAGFRFALFDSPFLESSDGAKADGGNMPERFTT